MPWTLAEPAWQEILRARLAERNARESAFAPVIEQYRKLAQQAKLLKERNASLLRAVGSVRTPGTPGTSSGPPAGGEDNPVRAAYMASLESQISSLRDELATVYKTQGQNAQRLLAMNETLREKEELSRVDTENLRKYRDDIAVLRRKVDQHNELMAEKDRTVQILHDEISTLQLELGQIEERNQTLTKDNAKLLQRWLDTKQAEANKMNEANEFYENMRSRHQTVLTWRDGSTDDAANGADSASQSSVSGNGEEEGEEQPTQRKDGTPSPAAKGVDLTPNG
ncbi:ATG16-domain-containing protein [Mycena pura]|uniref:ATG16-domain-containing protein n=1 Tax=Mycena pura TaxID=153505 RepID=A0AAD7E334_9AGAR|nr:ATG16-domain-containing protein [Mycena pura]